MKKSQNVIKIIAAIRVDGDEAILAYLDILDIKYFEFVY